MSQFQENESIVEYDDQLSKEALTGRLVDTDVKIRELNQDLKDILELRLDEFTVLEEYETNEIDSETGQYIKSKRELFQSEDGIYDDPSYNSHVFRDGIGLRKGGTVEYGNEVEKYDDAPDDSLEEQERKRKYRKAIVKFGQKNGFLSDHAGVSNNETDRYYTVQESKLEPSTEPVEAIVVLGAAGKSNVVRAYDAFRHIASGTVNTDKIILAGCDRPSNSNEMNSVQPFGTVAGETEIESMMFALRDVVAQDPRSLIIEGFDLEKPQLHEVPYGKELVATTWTAKMLISGREVEVIAVSAPFDPERIEREGGLERANTDETFLASLAFLPEKQGKVIAGSHDAWGPGQAVAAEITLGLEGGKDVVMTNALYDDRLRESSDGLDIRAGEQIIDEGQKLLRYYTRLRTTIETKLAAL